MGVDEGVVRGFVITRDEPEDQAADSRQDQHPDDDRDEDRPFLEALLGRLILFGVAVLLVLDGVIALGFRPIIRLGLSALIVLRLARILFRRRG